MNATHRAWPARRDLATVETQFLWLEGSIPYGIHDEVEDEQRANILEAIGECNEKTVTLVAGPTLTRTLS